MYCAYTFIHLYQRNVIDKRALISRAHSRVCVDTAAHCVICLTHVIFEVVLGHTLFTYPCVCGIICAVVINWTGTPRWAAYMLRCIAVLILGAPTNDLENRFVCEIAYATQHLLQAAVIERICAKTLSHNSIWRESSIMIRQILCLYMCNPNRSRMPFLICALAELDWNTECVKYSHIFQSPSVFFAQSIYCNIVNTWDWKCRCVIYSYWVRWLYHTWEYYMA